MARVKFPSLTPGTSLIARHQCGPQALAGVAADDWDTYYAIKDPACDLIIAGAEHWAIRTIWNPGPR